MEKVCIFIEDVNLRVKMEKAGRSKIAAGSFSIDDRNKKLKSVFDEAERG